MSEESRFAEAKAQVHKIWGHLPVGRASLALIDAIEQGDIDELSFSEVLREIGTDEDMGLALSALTALTCMPSPVLETKSRYKADDGSMHELDAEAFTAATEHGIDPLSGLPAEGLTARIYPFWRVVPTSAPIFQPS